jgi:trehalose synthase-fused probable maltokinase
MRTLEVARGWESMFTGAARDTLEQVILPQFLAAQRWFGGKARPVAAVHLADWAVLPAGTTQTFLALFEVSFGDGGADLYFLPLSVSKVPPPEASLATLRGRGEEAVLHDALADDDVCTGLLDVIGQGREIFTQRGVIRAVRTAAFPELRGQPGSAVAVSRLPATSSNSLVRYDSRLLLKLFRRLEVGINPDFEVGRYLTEKTTFHNIPRVGGAIEYQGVAGGPITLVIVQAYVPNQGDGWTHLLGELDECLARVAKQSSVPAVDGRPLLELAATEPPMDIRDAIGPSLQQVATLGRRTGELHRALACGFDDPVFVPEPMTASDRETLVTDMRTQGNEALACVRQHLTELPQDTVPLAQQFLAEGPGILVREPEIPPGFFKIRCHGDYHLGQVLWVENDFIIIDFEGEPTRTINDRRTKQSPLKDVAGMLRSFDYASHAALFAFESRGRVAAGLEIWAALWQRWTSATFLRAYLTAGVASLAAAAPGPLAALLDILMLDKACYELVYELNNRPDWVRIPLRGILSLLQPERPRAAT